MLHFTPYCLFPFLSVYHIMQYMIIIMQNRGNYMQNHEKNTYSLCHIVIAVLAVVLMGLIVWMMVIVSHMQGTARVVNYAGLVRGTTQRMVKLEMAGEPQDEMRREIEAYIRGFERGMHRCLWCACRIRISRLR